MPEHPIPHEPTPDEPIQHDAEPDDPLWDVLVVGAGPAGASAARTAAESGARVLLVDRARFPRTKTCGGGIIGTSMEWMPAPVRATVSRRVRHVRITRRGGSPIDLRANAPFLGMVDRQRFDQALVNAAVAAGADFRDGCAVRAIEERDDHVVVRTTDGTLRARCVVGADGTGGRVAPYVGVELTEVDLGLEAELYADVDLDRVLLDWGPVRGSYAWLFPKAAPEGRTFAAIGVIARRGDPDRTRAYLADWIAGLGLTGAEVRTESGHLTRVRTAESPLVRGRVLVAGDAAGLLEPWTREGISCALRSGCWAGMAAARAASGDPSALAAYAARIAREFDPERDAGLAVLRAFERNPRVVHAAFRTRPAQRLFVHFCLGRSRISRLTRHRAARIALRSLGR